MTYEQACKAAELEAMRSGLVQNVCIDLGSEEYYVLTNSEPKDEITCILKVISAFAAREY
jgi:hypothetical protein